MTVHKPADDRAALRARLLQARRAWSTTPAAAQAQAALQERVAATLASLEPDCLGLYWPMQGEFNPMEVGAILQKSEGIRLALPFARKQPAEMHFRAWRGEQPAQRDECGIPSCDGEQVVPDVVLVPCLGFTDEGWRLGYGGGYFDRYLAAHPHVTALGVAWDAARLARSDLAPEPHDIPLMAVLTECNTWSS